MDRYRQTRLRPALLLFAALLLRAVVPAGYMPGAAGSGLWFELCPEGLPAAFTQFLTGDTGHHHGHTDSANSVDDAHQCPVGHMLLSAAAVDDVPITAELAAVLPTAAVSNSSFTSVSRTHYHSRGPPA